MNKNIKLAVAGAVLALSASANAGIIIPAGEWTLDVNGNVNAFANYTHAKSGQVGTSYVGTDLEGAETNGLGGVNGGLASAPSAAGTKYATKQ